MPPLRCVSFSANRGCAGGWWWRDFNLGDAAPRFLADFGFGMLSLSLTLLMAIGLPAAVATEVQSGTWAPLQVRGVRRGEMLAGKGLGFGLVAVGFAIMATTVIALLLLLSEESDGVAGDLHWERGAALVLKSFVVAAGALFFASYARSPVFATLATLLWVLVGHLRTLAVGSEGGWAVLARVVPDLSWFESDGGPLPLGWLGSYALIHVLAYGGAAIWCFKYREL